MATALASFVSRYRKDAAALARALVVPVLLVDPFRADEPAEDLEAHRLKTQSAVGEVFWRPGEPWVFELRKQKENAFPRGVTVGRTRNNDVVLEHQSVSRFHGWFEWHRDDKRWRFVDAGSKNGTEVAGVRLAAKQPTDLVAETEISFGQIQARFLRPDAFLALLGRRVQDASTSSR